MNVLNDVFEPAPLSRALSVLSPARASQSLLVRGLLVVAVSGLVGMLIAMTGGHHVMGTTGEVPWGVLIATYVFFVASASGLCIVSSLGHVWGFKTFEPLAKKATLLAVVLLLVGFSVIASELERPFRLMKYALLSPNPTSPIWWMGTLYGVYLVFLLVELYFLLKDDHRRGRIAGFASFFAAIAAQSNLGAVFGLAHGRPAWNGPFLPIQFIALAMLSGGALLVIVHAVDHADDKALGDGLRKLLVLFIGVSAFMLVWKLINFVSADQASVRDIALASLTGPMFVSFWVFEVFLGLIVPLVLLLRPERSLRSGVFSAALVMLGIFVMRTNFVMSGQMMSLRPIIGAAGERISYQPPFKGNTSGFLSYTPSAVEVTIVLGAMAAATLLFLGATRALRVSQEARHE